MFSISKIVISSGLQNVLKTTINLKKINIIVGPNNSGKSTVLRDIETWFNMQNPLMKLVRNVEVSLSNDPNDYQEFENDILEFEDGERINCKQSELIPFVKQHLLTGI